eukprot:31343-Pelagococcus_subviridis.AAC.3
MAPIRRVRRSRRVHDTKRDTLAHSTLRRERHDDTRGGRADATGDASSRAEGGRSSIEHKKTRVGCLRSVPSFGAFRSLQIFDRPSAWPSRMGNQSELFDGLGCRVDKRKPAPADGSSPVTRCGGTTRSRVARPRSSRAATRASRVALRSAVFRGARSLGASAKRRRSRAVAAIFGCSSLVSLLQTAFITPCRRRRRTRGARR